MTDRDGGLGGRLGGPAAWFYAFGVGLAALGVAHLLTDPAERRPLYEALIVWALAVSVVHAGYEAHARSLRRESVVRALRVTVAIGAVFVALAVLVAVIWDLEGDQGHHAQFMLLFSAALGGGVGSRLALYEAHLREQLAENDALTKLLRVNERVLRHNLRNELTVALGHLENLEERLGDDADLRSVERHLEAVLATSDRARRVVGIWESDVRETFELRTLAVEAVANLHETHPGDARTSVSVPHGLRVEAHAALPQALAEVFENAVGHNDPPVELTVEGSVSGAGRVRLVVADDGAGIDRQEVAALFGEGETPLVHGGGVGLPLVYWVVRQSDGELRLGTRDGGGTEVELLLPRAE